MGNHYPLLDQKLDALRKAESDALEVNFDRMNGEDIERVARGIHSAPFLTKLHFMGRVNSFATHLFAEAVAERTDIKDFGWTSNNGDGQDDKIATVINALENSKELKTIYVTWSDAGDKTADAIIRRIEANPAFENLYASGAAWSQTHHDRLAEAVKDKESLVTLNTSARAHPLDDTKLGEAFTAYPHPNLLVPKGCHAPGVDPLKDKNNAACERAKAQMANIPDDVDQKAFNAAMSPDLLADMVERTPALLNYGAFTQSNLDKFQQLTSSLPVAQDTTKLATLFAADDTGFAPIENPQTWKQHPDLLDKLQGEGALDNAALTLRTDKGSGLMDMAILHRPAGEVLPLFNQHGLKLQQDALLTEDGTPTKLLERLHSRGDIPALFTEENWAGASPHALRSTVEALPEAMRVQVPPLNTLNLSLRAALPTRAGIGR